MDLQTALLVGLSLLGAFACLRLAAPRRRPLDTTDPADQLIAVRRATFTRAPILNRGEFERFAWIEGWARERPLRLFAQVSYGEILRSADRDAHASINAKRADFVLVDGAGLATLVIEYQGEGHHRGNAAARDRVKRAALERAGVPLLEIHPDETRREVVGALDAALGP